MTLRQFGLGFVFLFFGFGGIAHFAATTLEVSIVPPWIPAPRMMVYVSGVCELLGAAGIAWAPTRRWAGWGLILLSICVTPANIYMWQHAEQFAVAPSWVLLLRLPLQGLLIVLIGWSTQVFGSGVHRA